MTSTPKTLTRLPLLLAARAGRRRCWPRRARLGAAKAPRAHAAATYLTGVGDEQPEMFTNPLWQQLHTQNRALHRALRRRQPRRRHGRARSSGSQQAEAQPPADPGRLLPLRAHADEAAERRQLPERRREVRQAVPEASRQYQSWNEANRGNVKGAFASPSAGAAARYYQALKRVCKGCTVIGLDVLDAQHIGADAALHLGIQARNRAPAHGHAEDLGSAQLLRPQPPAELAHARTVEARSAARCG